MEEIDEERTRHEEQGKRALGSNTTKRQETRELLTRQRMAIERDMARFLQFDFVFLNELRTGVS